MLDEAIDAIARCANRLTDVVLDAINRDAVDELTTLLACPPGARLACAERGLSGDAGAAEQWGNWPAPGGAAAEEKRCCCANRGTDERCGKQVVLGVTRPPIPAAVAAGLADAWAPLRANRYRRSHHRAPLTTEAARAA